jgi:hypothetical protein
MRGSPAGFCRETRAVFVSAFVSRKIGRLHFSCSAFANAASGLIETSSLE